MKLERPYTSAYKTPKTYELSNTIPIATATLCEEGYQVSKMAAKIRVFCHTNPLHNVK